MIGFLVLKSPEQLVYCYCIVNCPIWLQNSCQWSLLKSLCILCALKNVEKKFIVLVSKELFTNFLEPKTSCISFYCFLALLEQCCIATGLTYYYHSLEKGVLVEWTLGMTEELSGSHIVIRLLHWSFVDFHHVSDSVMISELLYVSRSR